MEKFKSIYLNAKLVNIIVGLIGIVLILIGVLTINKEMLSTILISIGSSMFASAIIAGLNSIYLINQSKEMAIVDYWGLCDIYEVRAQINSYTNKALKKANSLDICAMGLKEFRDAQDKVIKERVYRGMTLRILTIDPCDPILSAIDLIEGVAEGSTKATINSLINWARDLQKEPGNKGKIEIKKYNHYPRDFYFNIDGTVFVGPYQSKTSQQTITYMFKKNSQGAKYFQEYFEKLWGNEN